MKTRSGKRTWCVWLSQIILLTACGGGETTSVEPWQAVSTTLVAPVGEINWLTYRQESGDRSWKSAVEIADLNNVARWHVDATTPANVTIVYARTVANKQRIYLTTFAPGEFSNINVVTHGIAGGTFLSGTVSFNPGAYLGHIQSEQATASSTNPQNPAFTIEVIDPVQDVLAVEYQRIDNANIPSRFVILQDYNFATQSTLNIDFSAGLPATAYSASFLTPNAGDYKTVGLRTANGADVSGLFVSEQQKYYLPGGTLPTGSLYYFWASTDGRDAVHYYADVTQAHTLDITQQPPLNEPTFDAGAFQNLNYTPALTSPPLVGWYFRINQGETIWEIRVSKNALGNRNRYGVPDLDSLPALQTERRLLPGVAATATIFAVMADSPVALFDNTPVLFDGYRQENAWKIVEFTP